MANNKGKNVTKKEATVKTKKVAEETAAKNIEYLFGKQVGNKYNIYEKDYLEDGDGARRVRPKSVLAGAAYSTDVATKEYRAIMGRVEFSNPKPVAMIKDLIEYATNPVPIKVNDALNAFSTNNAIDCERLSVCDANVPRTNMQTVANEPMMIALG